MPHQPLLPEPTPSFFPTSCLPHLAALLLAAAISPACSEPTREAPEPEPAAAPELLQPVATRSESRGGRTFTRQKLRAPDGSTVRHDLDDQGRPVTEEQLPAFSRAILGPELTRALAEAPGAAAESAKLDVRLVLRGQVEESGDAPQHLDVQLRDNTATSFTLDGKPASGPEVTATNAKLLDKLASRQLARAARHRGALETLAKRHQWSEDAALAAARQEPQAWVRRSLTREQIAALADKSSDLIEQIELHREPSPSISGGLASIGVDYWAHAQGFRGGGVGIYMSEAGGICPVAPHIDPARFTNLGSAGSGWHADLVGNILVSTAPHAQLYCSSASMIANPAAYWPRIQVTNHSFNYYTTDTSYWSQDRDFDDAVYNNRLSVFVSAGNGGAAPNHNVLTPAKAFNVFAVGNYDDATNTMNPGSRYANPSAGHEKPEISAPGTNIFTSAGGGTGTSASAPFAAGFAANLLGQYTWLAGHPEAIRAMMMAGASRNLEGAAALSDVDGAGGINYLNTAYNGSLGWWVGANNSWFDAANKITLTRYLTAGQRYRMVASWLVSGSYAFSNNNVNMDIDMWINAPSGAFAAGSYSYDNNFELVDFTAAETGYYTITINRYWNSGVGDVILAHQTQAVL